MDLRPIEGDVIAALAEIFACAGQASYLGEEVTMAEHMLQTAALAAGAPGALIAAALLHDVGHFAHAAPADDDWHRGHDEAGARFLSPYFGPEVVEPMRLHVAAKRYLVTVEPSYFTELSPASVITLEMQGGALTDEEAALFEANPRHKDALRLRRWEEDAKSPGRPVPPFAHYGGLLRRLLAVQTSAAQAASTTLA